MRRVAAWLHGYWALSLIMMASLASATQWPIPEGFKVVNDDSLNNRVKNGDIIRYVWVEENFEFALVFLNTGPPSSFVPPNSTFYLSLITKPGGDASLWNTVWSANRDMPVKENATLALDSSGNLVLTDSDGSLVWSTQIPNGTVAAAVLDLTGNLQLVDGANKTLWQSFDGPDDSLLPGQYLKSGNSLVSAVSTISSNGIDYSSGKYSMDALPGGLALNNGSSYYYIQSAETEEVNNISVVLSTCLHPNDVYFNSSLGLVIKTDLTKNSTAADPSICGHGDQKPVSVVLAAPYQPAGFTSRFIRIGPDGAVRMFQYDIPSRAYQVVGWGPIYAIS